MALASIRTVKVTRQPAKCSSSSCRKGPSPTNVRCALSGSCSSTSRSAFRFFSARAVLPGSGLRRNHNINGSSIVRHRHGMLLFHAAEAVR